MNEPSSNDTTPTGCQSLRGALSGEEPNEPTYFAFSATLRIFGSIPDPDELTQRLGVEPTHSHRRGDRRHPSSDPYKHDTWLYDAPVTETEPLHAHIDALWAVFRSKKDFLVQLKQHVNVDVFLGYRSNCDHAGLELPHQSLAIFLELGVPFGLSIIVN